MSEESRLTYLQEGIKEARRSEKEANWMVAGGILIAALGWFIYGYFLGTYGILFLIFGIVVVIINFIRALRLRKQYIGLLDELERMASKPPKCGKCGKQLPKGNFAFCPFCGASLSTL